MEVLFQNIQIFFQFIFGHLVMINLVFAVAIVFFQRKDPKSVWAWLLILYFVPVLGFVFYMLVGTDMHKKKMFRTKEIEDKLNNAIRRQEMLLLGKELPESYAEMKDYGDLVLYHLQASGAILTDDNDVQFIVDGKEKFRLLLEDMKQARKSIHIQYYIMKDDEIFASMKEILLMKVREGVEVRILFDGMGA